METRVLLDLFIIFAAAKLAGEVFHRLRQPAVVGEILAGILIGPHLLGWISDPAQSHTLTAFAEVGVVFLLFTVGLETRTTDMLKVGKQATWVAILGVVLPFGLGLALMLALHSQLVSALFVATALGAVFLRGRALRGPLDDAAFRRLFAADSALGVAAAGLLATGLARAFAGLEKGSAFYLASHLFWTKMTLFVIVAGLEAWPMVTFIRWRSAHHCVSPTCVTCPR
jgi:uncharacterized membrane protein